MNKVCLVLACNIYIMPFYYKYEKMIRDLGLAADLIYWNRDGIEENVGDHITLIPYNRSATYNDGNKSKILSFALFASFVKKTIRKKQYSKVIFLGTYGGTPALLSNFLKSKHAPEYWLDIRDYSYENIWIYYLAETKAIKHASYNLVSSSGYKKFLPEANYLLIHNYDQDAIDNCKKIQKIPDSIIRISFIGNVRYFEQNCKLLNVLGNDQRFRLQFYGNGSEKLKEYCEQNQISNVDFHGRFNHEKTSEFYAKTDIINNIYGNSGIELTTALSNKLYFAAALEMPILVSPDTYMEEISTKHGFGFTFNPEDSSFADKLFLFYQEYQASDKEGNHIFINSVLEDEQRVRASFAEFLRNGESV